MEVLTADNVNQNLKKMEFPWPSPVISRGNELEIEVKKGGKFPFPDVIHAHAGDPQGMGQKPITFFQQLVSLCLNMKLAEQNPFPEDVIQRAKDILGECQGQTIGSYTPSAGLDIVRKQVAKYIEDRDGVKTSYHDVFLSSGATEAVRSILSILNYSTNEKPPGVMIPIPQYPLFSSTVTEYGMYQINYYLDEDNEWAISVEELRRALAEGRQHCQPRALVIINPGNPSGFVLSCQVIEEIIKFAHEEDLLILADEVYQYNVYDDKQEFISFHKVLTEMGPPYCEMELASFMSGSKGYMGECGVRSGYCEVINLDPGVKERLMTLLKAKICPTILGQVVMYGITNAPKPQEPSYALFEKEKKAILDSLKQRAKLCYEAFNNMEGVKCNKVVGAMYVYPRLFLSNKAIQKAKEVGQEPDEFYAMSLLENSGICVIPGCLFGQKPGTYHYRLTFLPQMDKLQTILKRIGDFHKKFMELYRE